MDDVTSSLRERVFFAARDGMSLTLYALLYEKNTDEIDDILNSVSNLAINLSMPSFPRTIFLMSSFTRSRDKSLFLSYKNPVCALPFARYKRLFINWFNVRRCMYFRS